MKNRFALFFLFVLATIFSACSSNLEDAYLSVTLPYGKSRSGADFNEYTYEVTVESDDGKMLSRRGKSGETISFTVLPGNYCVRGEAWNDYEIFSGESEASVLPGEISEISLAMSNVSQTGHIRAYPCENGVRFNIHGNVEPHFIDVNTESGWSARINFTDDNPGLMSSSQIFYPFSEKGERCYFQFAFSENGDWIIEEGAAIAGGGKLDLFRTKYKSPNASVSRNGVVRLDVDPFTSFDRDKASELLSKAWCKFSVWGVDGNDYEWDKFVSCTGPGDGIHFISNNEIKDYSYFINNGFNINSIATNSENWVLENYYRYDRGFVWSEVYICFKEWPELLLSMCPEGGKTPIGPMPRPSFNPASEHVSATQDAEGVKLTFTKNGDKNNITIFVPNGFILDTVLQDGDTQKDVYYPFTQKGEAYTFSCKMFSDNGEATVETVSAVAGGGIEGLFTGQIEDVSMTLQSDKVTVGKDPTSIFARDKLNLVEHIGTFFDFYGTNFPDGALADWDNFVANVCIDVYREDDSSASSNLSELLTGGLLKESWLDPVNPSPNVNSCQYLWATGGVTFSLKKWQDESFVHNGRNFTPVNNIIPMPTF